MMHPIVAGVPILAAVTNVLLGCQIVNPERGKTENQHVSSQPSLPF